MSNKKNRTKEEGKLDPYIQLVALEHANARIAELELSLTKEKLKSQHLELLLAEHGQYLK